ncbi:exopolysaccharide biosynthesis GT4 family glycosyltransferase EpsE [Rubellimicrobium sp. CFH 75288]|uniref:exopolysaccharide biosynthesis GT4 family glycosyltransferase EpsE n=1 Tax=Rubellimicrobium sp. CFH 75288 TaxID=2697034 RepID=UPI001411C9CB|nr:exopolysaccharide biosynthesis GT4 family glycosyltransferase EpsE [Rubellimicrobium sp. CFH 75288]NAZ37824.1 glycosyltransferase [Rubellimicrobium sp. CFH 75288]
MGEGPRIGYLVPQFPAQTHAFFWREVRALEAMGAAVALLSTRPPPPGLVAHEWSAEAARRTTYLMSRSPRDALRALPALPWREMRGAEPGLWRDLLLALPAAARLCETAGREGIGHVHVHSCGRAALVAALAERLGGPSYSLTLHGPLSDYGPGQTLKWRGARFATIITRRLLAEVKTVLREDRPARLVVQPMGVDVARFRRARPYVPWTPGSGPLQLLCCARLNPAKGHEILIEAVRRLRAEGLDLRLLVLGEDDDGGGGYRAAIEAAVARAGLEEVVALPGAADEGAVVAALHRAHLFALASHHEPLGVAFMEAMAAGVPVIGTAAGGVRELVTHGVDGILVPPRDPAALACAIRDLALRPARAIELSMAGLSRVEEAFDSRRGAETLLREMGLIPARPAGD